MKTIRWGILGAGDVAEVKSGPAFYTLPASRLVAVMRRDPTLAADFARRHGADRFYSDAEEFLADPDIDAIYVATPPSTHAELTCAALAAGKSVYVEKPISTDTRSADSMLAADSAVGGNRLVVAHYRRALPLFEAVASLLRRNAVGPVPHVDIRLTQRAPTGAAAENWRLDPAISGGGLFHDLAPHQIDLMMSWFGHATVVSDPPTPPGSPPITVDGVRGTFVTESGVRVRGFWDFDSDDAADECVIIGTAGTLTFPFFAPPTLKITDADQSWRESFVHPPTVQQPFIARVNDFFRGEGPNPCPPSEARHGLAVIEDLLAKSHRSRD
ncbi:MAG: Gfo/Idh/MocA family oxidoreductase [Chthoniobacterales bacterium]